MNGNDNGCVIHHWTKWKSILPFGNVRPLHTTIHSYLISDASKASVFACCRCTPRSWCPLLNTWPPSHRCPPPTPLLTICHTAYHFVFVLPVCPATEIRLAEWKCSSWFMNADLKPISIVFSIFLYNFLFFSFIAVALHCTVSLAFWCSFTKTYGTHT